MLAMHLDRISAVSRLYLGRISQGKRLMAACAPTVKRMSLELGGNAPFIVFEDADIDEVMPRYIPEISPRCVASYPQRRCALRRCAGPC